MICRYRGTVVRKSGAIARSASIEASSGSMKSSTVNATSAAPSQRWSRTVSIDDLMKRDWSRMTRMMAGIFYGAQYGGSITAILVRVPGEASSVVTCLDGYAMAM